MVKELNRVVKEQREKIDHLCKFHNDAASTFETRIAVAKEQSERLEQAEADLEVLLVRKVDLENELWELRRETQVETGKETERYEAGLENLRMERDAIKKKLETEVSSISDVSFQKLILGCPDKEQNAGGPERYDQAIKNKFGKQDSRIAGERLSVSSKDGRIVQ